MPESTPRKAKWSPAALLDWLVKDPKKRFYLAEYLVGAWIVVPFTIAGLVMMGFAPTVVVGGSALFFGWLLDHDLKRPAWVILYVVYLFSSGWGFGLGIRDLMRSARLKWQKNQDRIAEVGYQRFRKETGRWL